MFGKKCKKKKKIHVWNEQEKNYSLLSYLTNAKMKINEIY